MKYMIIFLFALMLLASCEPQELEFNRVTVYLCHDPRNYGLQGKSRTLPSNNTFAKVDGKYKCLTSKSEDARLDSIRLEGSMMVEYLDHGRLQIIYSNSND